MKQPRVERSIGKQHALHTLLLNTRQSPNVEHIRETRSQHIAEHGNGSSHKVHFAALNLHPANRHFLFLTPLHLSHSNGIPHATRDVQQLHIKRPALQMEIGEDAPRRASGKELEPALRVGNAVNAGQHHHKEVEAIHQHVAVPRSLPVSALPLNHLRNRILPVTVSRADRDIAPVVELLLELLDFRKGCRAVRIRHEDDLAAARQSALRFTHEQHQNHADGSTLAAVVVLHEHTDVGVVVVLRILPTDFFCPIFASIVDDDDLPCEFPRNDEHKRRGYESSSSLFVKYSTHSSSIFGSRFSSLYAGTITERLTLASSSKDGNGCSFLMY